MALLTSAWTFCFLGSTIASVTASCSGAFWVLDHRHTASPDSNVGSDSTDDDREMKRTLNLGSLQELLRRASAFPLLGQHSYLVPRGRRRGKGYRAVEEGDPAAEA